MGSERFGPAGKWKCSTNVNFKFFEKFTKKYIIFSRVPKRVKIPQGPVIKIVAGYDHTLALLSTGEVYGWGSNENGQLKIDSANFLPEPTLLKVGKITFLGGSYRILLFRFSCFLVFFFVV